jgi:hypothetical protein
MSTPCARSPRYSTETPNSIPLSIVPVSDAVLTPDGCGKDGNGAWAKWTLGGLVWNCRLTASGLDSSLSGSGTVALRLPAFAFDGESETRLTCDGKSLSVAYRGWVCRYETDGKIVDTGMSSCNRNGRYRVFEARSTDAVSVHVFISKEEKSSESGEGAVRREGGGGGGHRLR